MKVGVLALQGAFDAHARMLAHSGVGTVQVRTPAQLADVDRLVVPGGESTTISMMLERSGLVEDLAAFIASGRPVFGTCAGAILLAAEIAEGRADQLSFGALPVRASRNAFGRQRESFESDLEIEGMAGGPFHAVFIRAPQLELLEGAGDGDSPVEVLARIGDSPALVRSGSALGCTFHPELSGDTRVHDLFCEM